MLQNNLKNKSQISTRQFISYVQSTGSGAGGMIGPRVAVAVDRDSLTGGGHVRTHDRRSMGTIASETL